MAVFGPPAGHDTSAVKSLGKGARAVKNDVLHVARSGLIAGSLTAARARPWRPPSFRNGSKKYFGHVCLTLVWV